MRVDAYYFGILTAGDAEDAEEEKNLDRINRIARIKNKKTATLFLFVSC